MIPRPTNQHQEKFAFSIPLAAASADTVVEVAKPTRAFTIDSCRYVNPTGLAADATNFFDIQVLIGATVAANWSTETGEEGTLAAATWVDLTNGSAANRYGDAGDEISVNLDETATATLPAGVLYIEGTYL